MFLCQWNKQQTKIGFSSGRAFGWVFWGLPNKMHGILGMHLGVRTLQSIRVTDEVIPMETTWTMHTDSSFGVSSPQPSRNTCLLNDLSSGCHVSSEPTECPELMSAATHTHIHSYKHPPLHVTNMQLPHTVHIWQKIQIILYTFQPIIVHSINSHLQRHNFIQNCVFV